MGKRKVFLINLLIMLIISFTGTANASGHENVIKAVEAEGLSRIERSELFDLIGLRVGDNLDMKELKLGIKRAFKKAMFLDIKVISEPYNGGIKLKYMVKEIPLINKIIIKGNIRFHARRIKSIFILEEGEDFKEEFVGKAISDLRMFYNRKGYPEAKISIFSETAKNPNKVDVTLSIDEGPPVIIKDVIIPEDAAMYLRVFRNTTLDKDSLEKGIERVRNYYKSRNYIKPVIGHYEIENGVLVIPVHTGPKLKLSFKGNRAFIDKYIEKVVTLVEDEEVSDETVEDTVEQIKRFYLNEGFYYAQVAASLEANEDLIHVTFYIFEGKKVKLAKINFQGTGISTETIKKFLPFKEGRTYNEALLISSKEALVQFYNALGYLNMEVSDIVKRFNSDGTELEIEFVINEGTQTKIENISITGNIDFGIDEIWEVIRLEEGSPYNVIDIGDSRYRVLSLYGNDGYLDAIVDVESRINGDKAYLTYKITENKPSVIGKTIIRGNYKTRTKVIAREFNISEGAPYNYEKILKIRQRLYKLGIFNEVSIEMLESEKKMEDKHIKDVLVSLKEGKAGSVEFGLGYSDYEQLRGTFDISYRNVDGYSRLIGLRTEMSSVEKRIVFNFREPRLFNMPDIPLNIFVMKEIQRSINLDTNEVNYKIDRLSILFNVEKELMKGLKANLNYEFSFVDTSEVKSGVILSKEDTGTLQIGSMSPSLFYDTRDNPFNPTSGALYGVVLKFASELFLSETEFVKGIFQGSWFTRLNKRVVFAFSLKGGAAKSFDDIKELPLVERFFLGGRTTVRGYSHDSLGPKGSDGNPTGGNMFTLGNAEFRISLGKGFGLVTFLDNGNVWQTAEDTKPETKFTAGAGLRYNTPVGPVRLDYGYKLNKVEGESKGELHFSFGHAF